VSRWPLPGRRRRCNMRPGYCSRCGNPVWMCRTSALLERAARWPRVLWGAFRWWRMRRRLALSSRTPDADPSIDDNEKRVPAPTETRRR